MMNIPQENISCPKSISASYIKSVWGKEDLELHTRFELADLYPTPHLDLTVELADLYPTSKIDFTVELADLYPTSKIDFTVELADLYPSTQSTQKTFKVKERKRLNETSTYLYADNEDGEIRYSDWQKKMIFYIFGKHKLASSHEEAKDLVGDFLTWAITKNKLAEKLNEGKKIYFNWIQSTMFWQFITQTRQKQGQDGHARLRHKYARTESEKKKQKDFVWVPPKAAHVFNTYDESTRAITSSDMYYEEESHEIKMHREIGWSKLYSEFELCLTDKENAKLWTSILSEYLQGSFEGVSDTKRVQDEAWAESHNISVVELRSIRKSIFKVLKSNKQIIKITQEYFVD